MNLYRFLGAFTEIIGEAKYDSLGQLVKLKPEIALDAIKGGMVMIPDADYKALGITADEEKRYRYVGQRQNPDAVFAAKLRKGLDLYHRISAEGKFPVPALAPAAPVTPAPTKVEVAK